MNKITQIDYLKAAAAMVEKQAAENPGIGIPVDPDVAEFMGAFEETAAYAYDLMGPDQDEDD